MPKHIALESGSKYTFEKIPRHAFQAFPVLMLTG